MSVPPVLQAPKHRRICDPRGSIGAGPVLTGKPFNDVYRFMDWLLIGTLLLMAILFCMELTPMRPLLWCGHWVFHQRSCLQLAISACSSSEGTSPLSPFASHSIVKELPIGLRDAINKETAAVGGRCTRFRSSVPDGWPPPPRPPRSREETGDEVMPIHQQVSFSGGASVCWRAP